VRERGEGKKAVFLQRCEAPAAKQRRREAEARVSLVEARYRLDINSRAQLPPFPPSHFSSHQSHLNATYRNTDTFPDPPPHPDTQRGSSDPSTPAWSANFVPLSVRP
jgi:hypothetical protein